MEGTPVDLNPKLWILQHAGKQSTCPLTQHHMQFNKILAARGRRYVTCCVFLEFGMLALEHISKLLSLFVLNTHGAYVVLHMWCCMWKSCLAHVLHMSTWKHVVSISLSLSLSFSLSLSLFHSLCALFSACKLLQQTCGSGYSLVNGAPHPITMSIEISDDELVGHDMPDLLALCRDFGYDDSADEGFSHTCKNPSQALD
jgi:hypothetical protein